MEINRFRLPGLESRFTRAPRNKAFLVILRQDGKPRDYFEESETEMTELARAASIRILGVSKANLRQPNARYFIGTGKLDEICLEASEAGANVLLFNVHLSPAQEGNIESVAKIPAIDRTGLILDVFGKHARTREGRLQVELAQLQYALPRLGGWGTVMSRLGGGTGTRGPGEQELEKDRRKIRKRIQQVKEDIDEVRKHRDLLRSRRRKNRFTTVSLVGYTNAGKSTLLNSLTGTNVPARDQMFSTLDPVTRRQSVNRRTDLLFTDTVGFLSDLPHTLIRSFHATLEETAESDVLLHVLDVSHPKAADQKRAVEEVLTEIKAAGKPVILALNKADLLDEEARRKAAAEWPQGILISAKEGLGLRSLMLKLEEFSREGAAPSLPAGDD